MAHALEKYAHDLALAATTGNREPLVSVAQPFMKTANPDLAALLKDPTVQRYLLGGLGGAGLGALIGYMQPNKKKRNALSYGLMGGLGGLGLAHLMGYAGGPAASKTTGEQTANETIAAARAAGMDPVEYLKSQRGPDAAAASSEAFNKTLANNAVDMADSALGAGAAYGGLRLGQNALGRAANTVRRIADPSAPKNFAAARRDIRAARQSSLDAANAVRTKTVSDRGTPLLTGRLAHLDPANQEYAARRQQARTTASRGLQAAAPAFRVPTKVNLPVAGLFSGPKITSRPVNLSKVRGLPGRALNLGATAYGLLRGLSGLTGAGAAE